MILISRDLGMQSGGIGSGIAKPISKPENYIHTQTRKILENEYPNPIQLISDWIGYTLAEPEIRNYV